MSASRTAAATTCGTTSAALSGSIETTPTLAFRPGTPRTGAATPDAPPCNSPVHVTLAAPSRLQLHRRRHPAVAARAQGHGLAGRARRQRMPAADAVSDVEARPRRL